MLCIYSWRYKYSGSGESGYYYCFAIGSLFFGGGMVTSGSVAACVWTQTVSYYTWTWNPSLSMSKNGKKEANNMKPIRLVIRWVRDESPLLVYTSCVLAVFKHRTYDRKYVIFNVFWTPKFAVPIILIPESSFSWFLFRNCWDCRDFLMSERHISSKKKSSHSIFSNPT